MSLGEGRHVWSSNDTNASVKKTWMHHSSTYVRTFLSFCLPARILAVKSLSTSGFPDLGGHEEIPSVLGVLDAGSGGGGGIPWPHGIVEAGACVLC